MGRQHGCRDALLHPQHSLGLGHKAPLLPHCSCGCKGLRGLFSALLPLQWVPSWSGAGGTGPRDRNTGLEPLLLPKGRAAEPGAGRAAQELRSQPLQGGGCWWSSVQKAQEGGSVHEEPQDRPGSPPGQCWELLLLLAAHPTRGLRAQVWKCFRSCWK